MRNLYLPLFDVLLLTSLDSRQKPWFAHDDLAFLLVGQPP